MIRFVCLNLLAAADYDTLLPDLISLIFPVENATRTKLIEFPLLRKQNSKRRFETDRRPFASILDATPAPQPRATVPQMDMIGEIPTSDVSKTSNIGGWNQNNQNSLISREASWPNIYSNLEVSNTPYPSKQSSTEVLTGPPIQNTGPSSQLSVTSAQNSPPFSQTSTAASYTAWPRSQADNYSPRDSLPYTHSYTSAQISPSPTPAPVPSSNAAWLSSETGMSTYPTDWSSSHHVSPLQTSQYITEPKSSPSSQISEPVNQTVPPSQQWPSPAVNVIHTSSPGVNGDRTSRSTWYSRFPEPVSSSSTVPPTTYTFTDYSSTSRQTASTLETGSSQSNTSTSNSIRDIYTSYQSPTRGLDNSSVVDYRMEAVPNQPFAVSAKTPLNPNPPTVTEPVVMPLPPMQPFTPFSYRYIFEDSFPTVNFPMTLPGDSDVRNLDENMSPFPVDSSNILMEAQNWQDDDAFDFSDSSDDYSDGSMESIEDRMERGCSGVNKFPIYFINLQRQPNRRKYMEETFGTGIVRIGATNGTNFNAILNKFRISDPEAFLKDPWGFLRRELRTTPGELGALISHLDAIKRAYYDKHEYVLILEDDIGTQLCPYWPTPLTSLKVQADMFYPGWHSLQLQWTPTGNQAAVIREKWFSQIIDRVSSSGDSRFEVDYGKWDVQTLPLIGRVNTLHGNGATLYSRAGMRHILDHYLESIISHTHLGQPIRKWHPDKNLPASPDYILRQNKGAITLFAVPPFFAQRFVDDVSVISNDLDWRRANLFGSVYALQWYMELHELYRTGSRNILPLQEYHFGIREY